LISVMGKFLSRTFVSESTCRVEQEFVL
jgi:hypothetical protein